MKKEFLTKWKLTEREWNRLVIYEKVRAEGKSDMENYRDMLEKYRIAGTQRIAKLILEKGFYDEFLRAFKNTPEPEPSYCERCGVEVSYLDGYEEKDGTVLCDECGDEVLSYDDTQCCEGYPYIYEDAGEWDGSEFIGPVYKRR